MDILNQAIGQLVALVAFFAFPASQYLLLKALSRKEGNPELWYLPDHGFRLVIRNLPRKKVLTDIKYHAYVRQVTPPSPGSSVASITTQPLITREDMVLFPGTDQILLAFQLYLEDDGIRDGNIVLVRSSGSSSDRTAVTVGATDFLVCDYSATIQNFFNFDIQVGKRVEINGMSLFKMLVRTQEKNVERNFSLDRVRSFQ
jgi:hypothetical protein